MIYSSAGTTKKTIQKGELPFIRMTCVKPSSCTGLNTNGGYMSIKDKILAAIVIACIVSWVIMLFVLLITCLCLLEQALMP